MILGSKVEKGNKMLDNNRLYEMTVRPLGKSPADEYMHNGAIWIEGREGNTYTIDIKNNTYTRALFVISVDGLDIMDGKAAGLDSRGYIVNAFQTLSIPGWSLNKDKTADFFFSRSKNSYVNEIGGSTANTGVIGTMVFSEKVQYQYNNLWPSLWPQTQPFLGTTGLVGSVTGIGNNGFGSDSFLKGASYNCAAVGAAPTLQHSQTIAMNMTSVSPEAVSQEIGTGFGAERDFKTVEVNFEKNNPNNPDCILAIYYNTARNLEKMGISLRRKHNVEHKANPFPNYSSPSSSTGCKPPGDWRR